MSMIPPSNSWSNDSLGRYFQQKTKYFWQESLILLALLLFWQANGHHVSKEVHWNTVELKLENRLKLKGNKCKNLTANLNYIIESFFIEEVLSCKVFLSDLFRFGDFFFRYHRTNQPSL